MKRENENDDDDEMMSAHFTVYTQSFGRYNNVQYLY